MRKISVVLMTGLLFAACQTSPANTTAPANSDPVEVVTDYLQALVHGDCAMARTLMTEDALAFQEPFCDQPRLIGYSQLIRQPSAGNAPEVDFAMLVTIQGGGTIAPNGDHRLFVQLLVQPGGTWRVNAVDVQP
jgi:hypothetical protein